jgi:hypothetical protein
MKPALRRLAAAVCTALCTATATAALAAAGLTRGNYVEVADTIVDMLDPSPLVFSTLLLGRSGAPQPVSLATGRTQAFSTPCPGGGSVAASVADRDASGDVSVQDRFVTVFNACRVDAEVISGSSDFVITASRSLNGVETTELAFRFHHLGSRAMRWDGSARVVLKSDLKTGAEHYVVTYQDLAVTRGTQATRWNFTLETHRPPLGDHTALVTGSMTLNHAVLQMVQDDPFVIAPGGRPRAGLLTATDAAGDRVEIEAGSRRYDYRFFARGNRGGAPDSRSQSRPHGGP